MDRIYKSSVSSTPPAFPSSPSYGYAQSAVAWANFNPTQPGVFVYFYIAESLRNVIVAAGLTPDPNNLQQLAEALEIFASGGP